jgi:hypothetical protein
MSTTLKAIDGLKLSLKQNTFKQDFSTADEKYKCLLFNVIMNSKSLGDESYLGHKSPSTKLRGLLHLVAMRTCSQLRTNVKTMGREAVRGSFG